MLAQVFVGGSLGVRVWSMYVVRTSHRLEEFCTYAVRTNFKKSARTQFRQTVRNMLEVKRKTEVVILSQPHCTRPCEIELDDMP